MGRVSDIQAKQTPSSVPTTGDRKTQTARRRQVVGIALWVLGLLVLAAASIVVHSHPAPWPAEFAFTKDIQGSHPVPCVTAQHARSSMETGLDDVSLLNDPIPSVVTTAIYLGVLLLVRWFRQALFFVVSVATAGGLFLALTPLVGRPRPSVKEGICVHDMIFYHSFPSGHVIHDVVCYGFLLYLTFTKPVRSWRYRWILIPFQVFAVLELLTIGYSRVLEGEHWLLDVLGGYLTGVLWLFLFIFLYRWTTDWLAPRRAGKWWEKVLSSGM